MLTKFFYNTMKGAPVLTNEWGSMLSMIKAVLITGFNQQQVTSASISDGVATITLGSNHGFIEHQCVAISGANQAGFNAEHRVISVTSTTITVKTTVTGAITGSMSIKTAPLGWTEKFTGSNKSIFEPKDKIKNPFVLRVDDSLPAGYDAAWAKFARVTIAEGANGIDDFAGFAKAPQLIASDNVNEVGDGVAGASGVYGWAKWYHGVGISQYRSETQTSGQGSNFDWVFVGNDSDFYFMPRITEQEGRAIYTFANIETFGSLDKYGGFLSATDAKLRANENSISFKGNGSNSLDNVWTSNSATGKYLIRSYDGLSASGMAASHFSLNTSNTYLYSGYTDGLPFPNKPDNSVVLHPLYIKDNDGLRGTLPIIRWVHQKWTLGDKVVLNKADGLYFFAAVEHRNEGLKQFFAFELRG